MRKWCVPVSDIKDPPPDFNGRVNIEDFWSSGSEEIVCRGFLKSKPGVCNSIYFQLLNVNMSVIE